MAIPDSGARPDAESDGGGPGSDASAPDASPGLGLATVYPPLPDDLYRSPRYRVTVVDAAGARPSYVYTSVNSVSASVGSRSMMSEANHWTSFDVTGPVRVEVEVLGGGEVAGADIRPASDGVVATTTGGVVAFGVRAGQQLYVDIPGQQRHPLFVFVNGPEVDPPSPGDPGVTYFAPGVHDAGRVLDSVGAGETIYLAGGAYVRGLYRTVTNADDITFRGRGILSGIAYPHQPTEWVDHLIEVPGSAQRNVRISGITLVDPPHTCIITRSPTVIDNVKLLGWHHNTDGITAGAGSTITRSFLKVNDDGIKLYYPDIAVSDIVMWRQPTGAGFQLSWNLSRDVTGVTVRDVDIVHSDRDAGTLANNINNALIASSNLAGGTLSGHLFEDIRIEGRLFQLIALQIQDTRTGFMSGQGTVEGLTLRSVAATERPLVESRANGNGISGEIRDLTFDGVVIGGERVLANDYGDGAPFLSTAGRVGAIDYR